PVEHRDPDERLSAVARHHCRRRTAGVLDRAPANRPRRSGTGVRRLTMHDLIVKDLTVEFTKGDYTVRPLDNLSFTVQAGSLALLLGPSGCGKTTLLSCLGGILKPSGGTIVHGDNEVTTLTGTALTQYRQRGVGVVFQAFNLVPSLTALENVTVPMRS